MIKCPPTPCGDETSPSCVAAGDYIFLAHHAGGFEKNDIAYRTKVAFESMKKTLASVGATLDDMVQFNYHIKNTENFRTGRDVFLECFSNGAPVRMTVVTRFLDDNCLCQIYGIAYKKFSSRSFLLHK